LAIFALGHASVIYDFSGTYTDIITQQVAGPVVFTLTVPNVITAVLPRTR